jgi:hypothetical protein
MKKRKTDTRDTEDDNSGCNHNIVISKKYNAGIVTISKYCSRCSKVYYNYTKTVSFDIAKIKLCYMLGFDTVVQS